MTRSPILTQELADAKAECERLREWVADLQSGMYINCVYCGHRFGPEDEVPATMADALKEHVEQCPEHPMSKLRRSHEALRLALEKIRLHHTGALKSHGSTTQICEEALEASLNV